MNATTEPLRTTERDAVIAALLPRIAAQGWNVAALRDAAAEALGDPAAAADLFPGGAVGAIDAWADLSDRRMTAQAEAEDILDLRTPARIRRLVEIRLTQAAPHRDALRRALGLLALPWNALAAARITARSVDAMWQAAGDKSNDVSWYTRRVTLAGVYSTTLAYWLREPEDLQGTLEFLDRRLAEVARFGQAKRRATGAG